MVIFFSSRSRHTRSYGDWSSDVCSSDLRLAESLGAEVRQMFVRYVDELGNDLRDVREGRNPVRVERAGENRARRRIDEALLRQRVPDALDDPALDLALGAERIDDAADVVDCDDLVDAHLSGLDVDGDLCNLDAERQDLHAGRVRPARSLPENLTALEQARDFGERS